MVIVVSIVLVLVTLVLPGLNALWNQRKMADAENTITGMLMTTRAKAMQSGYDAGLFFFVDDQNVQRVASIAQDPTKASNPATSFIWQNIFVVSNDRSFEMPAPMRVVPRFVIKDESDGQDWETYTAAELGHNDMLNPPGADKMNRHRNFFSVIYAPDGRLLVPPQQDVLLYDADEDNDRKGDITGLPLADPATGISKYYSSKTGAAVPLDNNPNPASSTAVEVKFIVADDSNVALNFPPVDGLLVYDDSLFNGAGDPAQKRDYLVKYAQPFYIHRMTGAVVRGPMGKNAPPTTP